MVTSSPVLDLAWIPTYVVTSRFHLSTEYPVGSFHSFTKQISMTWTTQPCQGELGQTLRANTLSVVNSCLIFSHLARTKSTCISNHEELDSHRHAHVRRWSAADAWALLSLCRSSRRLPTHAAIKGHRSHDGGVEPIGCGQQGSKPRRLCSIQLACTLAFSPFSPSKPSLSLTFCLLARSQHDHLDISLGSSW